MLLDGSPLLKNLTVKGEISNLTAHQSGHLYFSLKDEGAVIRAVMFGAKAAKLKFQPENGLKVLVRGKISVYPANGSYQILCDDMIPDGIGALQLAFEQLKRKLDREGLFDPAKKKPIPKIPRTVGVITSPTGAAIRDILQISKRRFPFAKVILYPSAVQGELAPAQLREGIAVMGSNIRPDVIIIGRGGGSAEDLWAFNDEALVRAVADCPVPVISAVGHEIDFTLCDFAADLRAPTPSAAAELAFPDTAELLRKFENVSAKLEKQLSARILLYRQALSRLAQSRSLRRPEDLLGDKKEEIALMYERLVRAVRNGIDRKTLQMSKTAALLDAINPLKVLLRGYAVLFDAEQKTPIRTVEDLAVGREIQVRVSDGDAYARIIENPVQKKEKTE